MYTDKSVDIDKVRGAVDRAVVRPAEDEAARIVAAAKEEAAALLNEAELRKAELVTEIAERGGRARGRDGRYRGCDRPIECLRQRANGIARDVEELRPVAAEVRRWEDAGKAERGAILDSIAARCAERREQLEEQLRSLRPHLGADASQEGATHRARLG